MPRTPSFGNPASPTRDPCDSLSHSLSHSSHPPWLTSPDMHSRALPPSPRSPIVPGQSQSLLASRGPSLPNVGGSGWRDPQMLGVPGLGLMDPPEDGGSGSSLPSGTTSGGREGLKESARPYLRVWVGGLERNRKDLLIRFDASVRQFPVSAKCYLTSYSDKSCHGTDSSRRIFPIFGLPFTRICRDHTSSSSGSPNKPN